MQGYTVHYTNPAGGLTFGYQYKDQNQKIQTKYHTLNISAIEVDLALQY